jgi:hypothetical protein
MYSANENVQVSLRRAPSQCAVLVNKLSLATDSEGWTLGDLLDVVRMCWIFDRGNVRLLGNSIPLNVGNSH